MRIDIHSHVIPDRIVTAIVFEPKRFRARIVPSPQVHPVVLQAGGSPRGTCADAHVADHVFGLTKTVPLMAQQRSDLDKALIDEGRDGILWSSRATVGETRAEANALQQNMIADVPPDAIVAWLSQNTGHDLSQLPPKFPLNEPSRLPRRPRKWLTKWWRCSPADAADLWRRSRRNHSAPSFSTSSINWCPN